MGHRTVAKVENKPGQWIILEDGKKVGDISRGSKDFRIYFSGDMGFALYRTTLEEAKFAAVHARISTPKQKSFGWYSDDAPVVKVEKKEKKRKKSKPVFYFAYGANTDRGSMAYRCPTAEPVGTATLKGWKLQFRGCADIVEEEGAEVQGAVWILYEEDERSLDRFEGFPFSYIKKTVRVVDEGGTSLDVMVYVMTDRRRSGKYLPSEGYLATLVRGYRDYSIPFGQLTEALDEAANDEIAGKMQMLSAVLDGTPN